MEAWQRLMNILGDPNLPVQERAKRFIIEPDGGRWRITYMNVRMFCYLDEIKDDTINWRGV
jgi:hypothetical protein